MNRKNPLLLPSGLYDLLPLDSRKESAAVERLLTVFEAFGYAQVTPPLLEFEASLLSARGENLSAQTFRIMDPMSKEMLALRSDITLQVARIARSRLANLPRPLRLCYAGPILQTTAESLKNERQLTQAGIELIGTDSESADAEAMIIAAESLSALGIANVSIDINLPGLLGELCPEVTDNQALRTELKDAIQRKDADAIARLPLTNSAVLTSLIHAAGPVAKALSMLEKLGLPQTKTLGDVTLRVQKNCPSVALTIDPLEYRGFDYHQGIGFSVFARAVRHELGRGGRYQAEGDSATGFTLYVTRLLRLLPELPQKKRVLVPADTAADNIRALHTGDMTTVYALSGCTREEATRLGCTHILEKGKVENL